MTAFSPSTVAPRAYATTDFLNPPLPDPQQLHADGDDPDMIALAAAYTTGIVRNHPFVDGNKRTGFVVGILLLEMNGYSFTAAEEDATQAVLGLAAGTLDETAFTAWLRANVKRQPQ